MRNNLGDKTRLIHIFISIDEILEYIKDCNKEEFLDNSMMKYATVKQLEIIGEAANYLSEDFKSNHLEIDWRQITNLRNVQVHEYFGIDFNLVWQIVKDDIPNLRTVLLNYIK